MSETEVAIGVIGVGWVGLVTAACFAELGHDVVAVDIDEAKVASLRAGEVTMHEPGIEELLERNAERLTFTTDMGDVLARARLLFCCVDTPPTYSGDADLSRVQAVVGALADDGAHALVMKSTVPAGTGAAIRREHPDLAYVACPEFLKEGSAVQDFLHPDRVVIGADGDDDWAADAVEELYRPLGGEMVRTDVASAEMIKLASNAFLATKISFINEIANVSEEVGADVTEVARGMGLDRRIGPSFLQAGLGFGGSCFDGGETVLVRFQGRPRLTTFECLWKSVAEADELDPQVDVIEPSSLEVWAWVPGDDTLEWMPVAALTRRNYEGEMVEVRTKMGRRLTVTADHPFIVGAGEDDGLLSVRLARDLSDSDWLPLGTSSPPEFAPERLSLMATIEDGHVPAEQVLVRPGADQLAALASWPVNERGAVFHHPRPSQRWADVKRSGTLRAAEAWRAGLGLHNATAGTAKNGSYVPLSMPTDERFWFVVGLYLAEGCVSRDRGRNGSSRERISWSFHPEREEHLVDAVCSYWESVGAKPAVRSTPTARRVEISSRLIASWWEELGLGRSSYDQRLPDLIWEQERARKEALLAGLWEGDGSWSFVNRGPSVALEFGTISDELADGVARLLGNLGIVASWRRGRTRKSTKLTHWLRVSGADQIERAIFLVPERQRADVLAALSRQAKRTAPTGYRSFGSGIPWVRVVGTESRAVSQSVYSLEVPGANTVATSGGLIAHNCFPKDTTALKQLAGNTGYHFQLLTSVIEVNELQKRRVLKKLEKHLGKLAGKRIALLGLAFKPNTDDMREASSLVLSARLQGEGAVVAAYDPVAEGRARELLPNVAFAASVEEVLDGADAAILVTEWPEFAELDWPALAGRMSTPLIVDGRNYLDPAALRDAGFAYEGIGRPA